MKILLCFLISYSLFGCNHHDLTNESARTILQTQYPQHNQQTLRVTGWCNQYFTPEAKQLMQAVQQLELTGYLTQSGFTAQFLDGTHTDCRIDFTEKAKPFLMKTTEDLYFVDAFHTDFGQVTGITDGQTQASKIVEFTTTTTATPFSPCFNIDFLGVQHHKASFQKYDDGWRFQEMLE